MFPIYLIYQEIRSDEITSLLTEIKRSTWRTAREKYFVGLMIRVKQRKISAKRGSKSEEEKRKVKSSKLKERRACSSECVQY